VTDEPVTDADKRPRLAGEVGPTIIGPMRRLKDGRWDWRSQSRRSLEAAVASWVVRILEDEGHRIEDLRSPDYDGLPKRKHESYPELSMIVDGEPSALDVTIFTTEGRSAAGARGQALRRAIEASLTALDDDRSILGMVAYDPIELFAVPKRRVAAQLTAVADAYEEAVRSSPDATDRLQLSVSLPWVRGASLTITPAHAGSRRRVSLYVLSARGDVAATVDQFIAERVPKKTKQLAPWGRGILVIVHGFDETAADVRAGFERFGSCPFWRVYWSGASPDSVELVAAG
jgi:hypothetical protein